MRDVMLAIFSASCFARWGFICMSSAMVSAKYAVSRGQKVHDVSRVGVIGDRNTAFAWHYESCYKRPTIQELKPFHRT
jgi:hypothetical protein